MLINVKINYKIRLNVGGTVHRAPTIEKYQSPISASIPTVVRYIKASTTRIAKIKLDYNEVLWQRNYYEHIIRNEKEYRQICEYIENNPLKWEFDKYY